MGISKDKKYPNRLETNIGPGGHFSTYDEIDTKPEKNIPQIRTYLNDNLIVVSSSINGGALGYITREFLEHFEPMVVFINTCLIDRINNIVYECNDNGTPVAQRPATAVELSYGLYTVYGELPQIDLMGNNILIPDLEEEKDEIVPKKVFSGSPLNIPLILMSKTRIRDFWEIIGSDLLPDVESNIERMIKIAVFEPEQFDEIFTIEVDRPESPLMVKFLNTLAELVNKNLETLGDEGLEDITVLQKEAFIAAGYEGKTFETVIEEQKDYGNYFRFLLTKGEKTVINEEQKLYFDKLSSLIQKECGNTYKSKKKKLNFEIAGISPLCYMTNGYSVHFKGLIPNLISSRSNIHAWYFTYLEDIYEVGDQIEKSDLSLKIALNDDLINEEFKEQVKKGVEVQNKVFVCDKNLNYATFSIKKSTISKWKKNLGSSLNFLSNVIGKGRTFMPSGLNDFTL